MEPLALASGILACITVVLGFLLVRYRAQNVELRKVAEERAITLERTSRSLIQKNLELNDQNLKQHQQLEAREDFVNIVSHQLRTPVTELGWGLEGILNDSKWSLPAEQRSHIEKLLASTRRMVHIINDILHLVHIEQTYDRTVVTPYDPDAKIREVAERIANDFAAKRIALSFDLKAGGTIYSIDADSFDMAISNLIENAYHYTRDGGPVCILSRRPSDDTLEIDIKDGGIGIRMADHDLVFVKFRRSAAAMEMNAQGSGLGLYIVKSIVERHGGTVGFTSAEGQGTTFRVVLPSARSLRGSGGETSA